MKKIFSFVLLWIFMSGAGVWAHPPSEFELSYDQKTRALHVRATHVTANSRKHFVRKIAVSVNDKEEVAFFFPKQTSPQGFDEDIPLEVQSGDLVKVKATCSEAGTEEASFKIP